MKIYNNINFIDKKFVNSVLAIGNFDGVHLGHQELLKKAYIFSRKVKKKFGILTFDPLPKDFFNKTDNRILNIIGTNGSLNRMDLRIQWILESYL